MAVGSETLQNGRIGLAGFFGLRPHDAFEILVGCHSAPLAPRRRSPTSPSKGGLPNVRRPKRIYSPLPPSRDPVGADRKRSSARSRCIQLLATKDELSMS